MEVQGKSDAGISLNGIPLWNELSRVFDRYPRFEIPFVRFIQIEWKLLNPGYFRINRFAISGNF